MARRESKKPASKPDPVEPGAVLYRSQSSAEVKRDAKGNYQYTVKAYADTTEEAVERAQTMGQAMDNFLDKLKTGNKED